MKNYLACIIWNLKNNQQNILKHEAHEVEMLGVRLRFFALCPRFWIDFSSSHGPPWEFI